MLVPSTECERLKNHLLVVRKTVVLRSAVRWTAQDAGQILQDLLDDEAAEHEAEIDNELEVIEIKGATK